MAKVPDLVIDIGHQNVKILQIQVGKKGGIRVIKAGVEPLIALEGEEEDSQYKRIQETFPILLQRLGIKGKRAIVTLPGRSAFTRRLKVPVVSGRQLGRIVQYEARQHIPFPLDQVNMDYQVSDNPGGDLTELEINLVAVRREIADAYVKTLKKCGIRADIIEVAPLSIYNAYAASVHQSDEEVTAIVSVGATSTDIVIEQNGSMQFMRSAPVAGNTLTALISKNLGISTEEAEKLKMKPASEFGETEGDISAEKVSAILEKGFDQIVTEVRRSFDFYVSQPDALPVTRIFLCGGTIRMEGAIEFLEDRLGVPVQILDGTEIEGLEGSDQDKSMLKYEASLVGMAVRAAGKASCGLSFAPEYIKDRLEFERRSPMFLLMAALLVVMIGGSIFFLDKMLTVTADAIEQVNEIVEPSKEFNPILSKVRTEQNNFKERYTRINQVAEKRGLLTRIYLEVQNLVPQDMWLDSIELTSRKFTITGKALNDERITSFYQNLCLSPFFDNEVVVLLDMSPSEDLSGSGSVQMDFTIAINRYNTPSDEDIRFVSEFRKITQQGDILLIKFDRETDPGNPTLIIGVYQQKEKERIALIRKVYSCLMKSKDETVKTIDLRIHDRESNLEEHMKVSRELVAAFWDKTKTQEEFLKGFEQITPLPSPTPSHTPTPEAEGDEGASPMMGGYGMGGYGMGGYGMPTGG